MNYISLVRSWSHKALLNKWINPSKKRRVQFLYAYRFYICAVYLLRQPLFFFLLLFIYVFIGSFSSRISAVFLFIPLGHCASLWWIGSLCRSGDSGIASILPCNDMAKYYRQLNQTNSAIYWDCVGVLAKENTLEIYNNNWMGFKISLFIFFYFRGAIQSK